MQIRVPEFLRLPPKLAPLLTQFNDYKFFVIEGGRGSGKSHSVARLLLYLAEMRKIRIFCGREIQGTIEDSVHAVLADLINEYDLDFTVQKNAIISNVSDSKFRFRGFREQGSVNIKGLEGVHIVWIDEAESISKRTLDVLIPTLRKEENVKLFFTMNRYMRDDAVMELVGRSDCLHLRCNYVDNPFCPATLKIEAQNCKDKSEREYKHIWLGEPLQQADEYLFNYDALQRAYGVESDGALPLRQRVVGIDFAAQGNDDCVAVVLDRIGSFQWAVTERIKWHFPDAMQSVGKIVDIIGRYKPNLVALDVGGMGHVVHCRLQEVGMNVHRFDGASTVGVDSNIYVNARAEGYYLLREWIDEGRIRLRTADSDIVTELEKIKMKWRSDGKRLLEPKVNMKKELGYSPDNADSLMIAVHTAIKYLGKVTAETGLGNSVGTHKVVYKSARR